jgi:hypothetical protein
VDRLLQGRELHAADAGQRARLGACARTRAS